MKESSTSVSLQCLQQFGLTEWHNECHVLRTLTSDKFWLAVSVPTVHQAALKVIPTMSFTTVTVIASGGLDSQRGHCWYTKSLVLFLIICSGVSYFLFFYGLSVVVCVDDTSARWFALSSRSKAVGLFVAFFMLVCLCKILCSPCVCVGSLVVYSLPPTVRKTRNPKFSLAASVRANGCIVCVSLLSGLWHRLRHSSQWPWVQDERW